MSSHLSHHSAARAAAYGIYVQVQVGVDNDVDLLLLPLFNARSGRISPSPSCKYKVWGMDVIPPLRMMIIAAENLTVTFVMII